MAENDPRGSLYALGALRHDKDEERAALEAAACQFIEEAEEAKWTPALQWFENFAYLCGNTTTRFYRSGGTLRTHTFGVDDRSPFDDVITQQIDNRLVRPFETVTGMLTQSRPKARVSPNSAELDDEDAAKIAAMLVDLTFENPLRMPELRQEAASIAMLMGTCFSETEYGDTDLPEPVREQKVVAIENPGPGQPSEELVDAGESAAYRSDIQARLWTPFHLSADPRATSDRDALFFIRSSFEDLYWIREQYDRDEEGYYPEALEGLGSCEGDRYALYWWSRLQDVIVAPQAWEASGLSSRRWAQSAGARNSSFTSVIDVKPSLMFPRGRTLIMVNKRLVYCGEQARAWSAKYAWRWHPYGFFHWLKLVGRFLGMPLLSLLVPLQKRINSIDAIVRTNREHLAIGQFKIARQSRVAEGSITGIPGQHITYTAVPNVPEPHRVEHVPLPSELLKERDDLVQAIDTIAATGVIGSEMASSAARAGVMLDFLRQERMQSKGPMLTSYEQFLERIGQNVLIEYQLGLLEEDPDLTARLRVAAKQFPSVTIQSFTGSSLRDHHAVRIDVASELLNSPEAKKERAATALQFLGTNASPQQIDRILRAMGLEEVAEGEMSVSVERARRIIARAKVEGFEAPKIDPAIADPNVRAAMLGFIPGVDEWSIIARVLRQYLGSEKFNDDGQDVKKYLFECFDVVSTLAQIEAAQLMQAQIQMQAAQEGAEKAGEKPARKAAA